MKNHDGEVNFTYSGVLVKENRRTVCVRFERKQGKNLDYAEGCVPECKILKAEGFTTDEILGLENYLRENTEDILCNAKKLNHISNWF